MFRRERRKISREFVERGVIGFEGNRDVGEIKASGYVIECSTDKKFKKNLRTVTIKKNKTSSKKVTKLKAGKKYYVRICAYVTADGRKIKCTLKKKRK